MVDSIPPAITPIGFKEKMNAAKLKQLVFVVTDNTEEIKQFTATLDGTGFASATIRPAVCMGIRRTLRPWRT